jgi:hypothetical protein
VSDQPPKAGDVGPEEYPLAPPEAQPTRADQTLPPGCNLELPDEEEPDHPEEYQFTLAELLLLVAGASVFLSIATTAARYFRPEARPESFAGLLGLAALVCWVLMVMLAPRRRIVIVAWWVLIGLYLLACVMAAMSR